MTPTADPRFARHDPPTPIPLHVGDVLSKHVPRPQSRDQVVELSCRRHQQNMEHARSLIEHERSLIDRLDRSLYRLKNTEKHRKIPYLLNWLDFVCTVLAKPSPISLTKSAQLNPDISSHHIKIMYSMSVWRHIFSIPPKSSFLLPRPSSPIARPSTHRVPSLVPRPIEYITLSLPFSSVMADPFLLGFLPFAMILFP